MALAFDEDGEPIKPDIAHGNRTTCTHEVQDKICAALYALHPVKVACSLVGVSSEAFYKWVRLGKQGVEPYVAFATEVEKALAQAEARIIKPIVKAAESGNTTDAKWLLERRFGDQWAKRDKVEIGGDPSQPISVQLMWPGQQDEIQNARPELPAGEDGTDDGIVDAEVVEDSADTSDADTPSA